MGSIKLDENSNRGNERSTMTDLFCDGDTSETDEDTENTTADRTDLVMNQNNQFVRFTDSDSEEDDDRNSFFMSCTENRINALIERMREFRDNLPRPEEFENQAVSMAIQQHGLKKNESECLTTCCDCNIEVDANNLSNKLPHNIPTTSSMCKQICIYDKDEDDEPSKSKKQKCVHEDDVPDLVSGQNNETLNFDDVDFLNEAVAVAIEKKGLCSSTLGNLE